MQSLTERLDPSNTQSSTLQGQRLKAPTVLYHPLFYTFYFNDKKQESKSHAFGKAVYCEEHFCLVQSLVATTRPVKLVLSLLSTGTTRCWNIARTSADTRKVKLWRSALKTRRESLAFVFRFASRNDRTRQTLQDEYG